MSTDAIARKGKSAPAWVWPTIASSALALAGWAHSLLMNHETRLAVMEAHQTHEKETMDELRMDVKFSREVGVKTLVEIESIKKQLEDAR